MTPEKYIAKAIPGEIKKHNSLIAAFGKHLVLTGTLPSDLGRMLNKVESF